ncbi:MAG TPA: MMPL family transporter [Solirubrobacterales bacterium]|nr:MMPL family transporter [Solirubrobacterales bacterium]
MSAIAAWAVRHARPVLAVAALLAIGAAVAAMQLSTDAGTDTLVDRDSESYRATERVREVFGEEPVVVVAEGDLQELILTPNLGRLLRLEGCLSGKVPKGAKPIPGPCTELAKLNPVQFLAGPGTFLNEAVIQIDEQLRRLAATVPPDQLREFLLQVAARYGITSAPSISNPEFLASVVFDLHQSRGTPKARLAYLFPNDHSTQIVLRLRPDLSDAERSEALRLIREAVYDTTPRQACTYRGRPEACFGLHGAGTYTITGAPVLVEGITGALKEALLILFAVAIAVMGIVLLLVFRSRWRLLPLAIALAAAALTFGLLDLFGGSLTIASIATLPILIGLVVDYAIQLQARFDEASANGVSSLDAARSSAGRAGSTIAIACLATAAGFLALQLSPIPMVRGFGVLLILGIVIGLILAFVVGFAALSLRPATGAGGAPDARGVSFFAQTTWLEKLRARRKTQQAEGHPLLPSERLVGLALSHPRRVLAIGGVLAVIGWGLGTQIDTVSDVQSLGPQGLREIKDLEKVQDATGVAGQLEVAVEAPDLSDPETIRWMADFKQRVLEENGFSGARPSCLKAEICPGPALSDFLVSGKRKEQLKRSEIRATLRELPPYDLEQLAPVDAKTGLPGHIALLSFGIRSQSLQGQQAVISRVRAAVGGPGSPGGPPAGVRVRLAGLPVITAAAASDLSSSRYWLTLAGLAAVALALLAAYRSFVRALVPLVPVVLATGWSSLVLWLSQIPLNPMSAALGALTIAIATEFSVILAARFREERGGGLAVAEAIRAAYARTGPAVFASAVTVIAGFAVLIASDVSMLRDFGFVTVIDLGVALLGVMVALPAALSWLEER